MSSSRRIEVEIVGDASNLEHAFGRSSQAAGQFGKDVDKAGRGAAAASLNFRGLGRAAAYASGEFLAAGGVVEALKKSVEQATSLQDQLRRTEAVFKSSSATVRSWSKTSAEAMGLSQSSALEAANTIGTLLENVGKTPAQAAAMSKSMVQLGSDMAAFKKVQPEVALNALEAALQGRTRSLKQFGITIDAASLKTEAYRLGIAQTSVDTQKVTQAQQQQAIAQAKLTDTESKYGANTTQVAQARLTLQKAEEAVSKAQSGSTSQLSAQQKAMAAYALIMDQTKNQQGAFARSGDELNIVEQKLHANLSNIEATVGQQLLPIMEKYGSELDAWVVKEQKNGDLQRDLHAAIVLTTAAIHGVTDVTKVGVTLFEQFSGAVGGSKHAVELLAGAYVVLKAQSKIGGLITDAQSLGSTAVGVAKKVGLIGAAASTNATETAVAATAIKGDMAAVGASAVAADGEVAALAASLTALETAGIVIPIVLSIMYRKQISNAISSAADSVVGALGGPTSSAGNGLTYSQYEKLANSKDSSERTIAAQLLKQAGGNVSSLPGAPGSTQSSSSADAAAKAAAGKAKSAAAGASTPVTGPGYAVNAGVDMQDENPMIAQGLSALAAAGYKVDVTSGYRSYAQQAALYARYVKSGFNIKYIAAKPGQSNHESGKAVDVYVNGMPVDQSPGALAILKKYGLVADVRGDHEHLDLVGYDGTTGAPTPTNSGGLVVGKAAAKPRKPKQPAIVRGSALLPTALANAIGTYSTKASSASTPGDALHWLEMQATDIGKAEAAVQKLVGQGSKKQQAATAAELESLKKQLDSVNGQIEKAYKQVADARFAAGVKSNVTRFISTLGPMQTRYQQLQFQTQLDTGAALESDYDAIAKNLNQQKTTLQGEVSKLTASLAGKDKAQRTAIQTQISRVTSLLSSVNGEIKTNLSSQLQALQSAVSAAQTKVGSSWSTYQQEIVAGFEAQTQKMLADLANDPSFFQNGAMTPTETLLAQMQQQDQLKSLQSAIDTAATPEDLAAAKRQLEEYQLGIQAQQERADADKRYAEAVQRLTDQRTTQENELTKVLGQFGDGLANGSVHLSDLQGWLDGANPEGWTFGLTLSAINDVSPLVASDFADLSTAAQGLTAAFQALVDWVNTRTGASVSSGATTDGATVNTAPSARSYAQSVAAIEAATGKVLTKGAVPFATGGIVTRPTIALIGEAGHEAVIPLDRMGTTGGGATVVVKIDKHYSLTNTHADARELAKAIKPHLDRIVGYSR